ncbi:MAG: hypothetical protein ACXWVS_08575 [Hyphomicrobium sp.]
MQALRAVVVVLGILIIISFVLLIYGFYARMTDRDFAVIRADEEAGKPTPHVGRITVPDGCSLADVTPFDDRLLVRLSGAGEACNRITIIDMKSGREVGAFTSGP